MISFFFHTTILFNVIEALVGANVLIMQPAPVQVTHEQRIAVFRLYEKKRVIAQPWDVVFNQSKPF
jgi:hypothetical protein